MAATLARRSITVGSCDPIRRSERIRAMTTLQMTRLGVVVEIRKSEETGGELVEFDVIGRTAGSSPRPTSTRSRKSATR